MQAVPSQPQDTLVNMTWTFAQIIERVSYGVDIFPGDIIGSGTCGTGWNLWNQVDDSAKRLGAAWGLALVPKEIQSVEPGKSLWRFLR